MLEPYKYYTIDGDNCRSVFMSIPFNNRIRVYNVTTLKESYALDYVAHKYVKEISSPTIPKKYKPIIAILVKQIKENQYYFLYDLKTVIFKLNGTIFRMNPKLNILTLDCLNCFCYSIPFPKV